MIHLFENSLCIMISLITVSLQHEKAVPCFRHTEKLIFVRRSSEYETSDSDRKVNINITVSTSFIPFEHFSVLFVFNAYLVF